MPTRDEHRIALEGNPVFTDLRLERDVLKEALRTVLAITEDQTDSASMIRQIRHVVHRALGEKEDVR